MPALSPASECPSTAPRDAWPDRGWYCELIALFDNDDDTHEGIGAVPRSEDRESPVLTLTVCPLRAPADGAVVDAFRRLIRPWWIAVGGDLLACFTGAPERPAIAWLSRFESDATRRRHAALLQACGCLARPEWQAHLAGEATEWQLAGTRFQTIRTQGETA
jgi:hypothetical protein